MTLEEAQERILELTEQNETLTSERDSLLQDKNSLTQDNENLRKLNQKYFNKLIAQDEKQEEPEKEETVPSCEEFAANLKI